MDLNLRGKTVVITGGSSGIGKSTARAYLKEGCNVAICARNQDRLQQVKREFMLEGHSIFTKCVDVCDYDSVSCFAEAVKAEYGSIHIWYNNAGSNTIRPLMDYSANEFRSMVDTLLVSVFSSCKIAALHMSAKGVIMNASSFAALIPNAGQGPYSACKAAVISLSQVFAAELASRHIRVLSYVPGLIETEISRENIKQNRNVLLQNITSHRIGTPEDLAQILVFLTSDAADYMNGVHVDITGGKFCVQNPMYAWK